MAFLLHRVEPVQSTPAFLDSVEPVQSTPAFLDSVEPVQSTPAFLDSVEPVQSTPAFLDSVEPVQSTPAFLDSVEPVQSNSRVSARSAVPDSCERQFLQSSPTVFDQPRSLLRDQQFLICVDDKRFYGAIVPGDSNVLPCP